MTAPAEQGDGATLAARARDAMGGLPGGMSRRERRTLVIGVVIVAAALFLTIWYGAEILLCAAAGWHLPLLYPVHAMLRDILLPVLWIEGWREAAFVWRGNAMSVDESSTASNEAGSAT